MTKRQVDYLIQLMKTKEGKKAYNDKFWDFDFSMYQVLESHRLIMKLIFTTGKAHTIGLFKMFSLFPKQVIDSGSFETEETLREEFEKIKNTQNFKRETQKIIENKKQEIIQREKLYQTQIFSAVSDKQRFYFDSQRLEEELKVLESEIAFSLPDIRITFTRDEAQEFLNNLRNSFYQYHRLNHKMICEAIEKFERVIEETQGNEIEISINIYTDAYLFKHKCSHQNYEQATGNTTLYLPSK